MRIDEISLQNYRNYEKINLKFNKNINIIIGDNAKGKTNILESIYFLSITKSYRTNEDINLINHGKNFFKIKGKIHDQRLVKRLEIDFTNKKKIFLNGKEVKKLSNYIGIFNVIMISPEDIEVIKGSPQVRRNLLNIELSQISKEYIEIYNEYNKLLKMRNDYLKILQTNSIADFRYLDIITDKLVERAIFIYQSRKKIIDFINDKITDIYNNIISIDGLKVKYVPNIDLVDYDSEALRKKIKHTFYKNRQKEITLGMTVYGPHRDDFEFCIENNNIKYFGSQGQQKLAVIAFKLTFLKLLEEQLGKTPVLLLDDVFSELDKKRKNKLIEYINEAGQVIITTNDIRDINKKKIKSSKIFEIKDKKIVEKGDSNGK